MRSPGRGKKPGPRDKSYLILITGRELAELKKFTWSMAEAFGLDRHIENYKGKRPIGLFRWDLDCLESVTELALNDTDEYPVPSGPEYEAMEQLRERIAALRKLAYAEIEKD